MKKLTKKQRHEIYKEAILYYEKNKKEIGHRGLCYVLHKVSGRSIYWCTPAENKYQKRNHPFPEILLFIYDVFPVLNWEKRKLILQFCIEMTK